MEEKLTDQKTVLFAPLNAWGHIIACSAIASELKNRFGLQIVFVINQSWKGRLTSKFGFLEEVYGESTGETVGVPSEDWTNLVTKVGPAMRQSSFEKIKAFGLEAQSRMVAEVIQSNHDIGEIIERRKPDLIVVDNYVLAPALISSNIPWIRLRSASPVEVNQTNVPPQNSGYAIEKGNVQEWGEFTQTQNEIYKPLWQKFSKWFSANCEENLPNNEFILSSPHLNLYLYPEELDYTDRRPMPEKWYRIDALVKPESKSKFTFPKKLEECGSRDKIIYLSLGTFGSADLTLMTRIVEFLGRTNYRVIVSKGPFHEKYELLENMWGEVSLPQIDVLPFVDCVICHGGNATLNECFYFGKPMIILPILGDEYDNAQRVMEKGYGVRLDPYNLTFEELSKALTFILEDPIITQKMKDASRRIQKSPGVIKAAELIMPFL